MFPPHFSDIHPVQSQERKDGVDMTKRIDFKKLSRREVLGLLGTTGAALTAIHCSGESPTSPTTVAESATTTTTAATTGTAAGCAVTPTETIGPYPSLVDLFRSDIREGKSGRC
jgi:hypothetical protein